MKPIEALASIIGILQAILGFSAIIISDLIYYNPSFFRAREILKITSSYVPLYILLLSMIGSFSIISGLLILYEWLIPKKG